MTLQAGEPHGLLLEYMPCLDQSKEVLWCRVLPALIGPPAGFGQQQLAFPAGKMDGSTLLGTIVAAVQSLAPALHVRIIVPSNAVCSIPSRYCIILYRCSSAAGMQQQKGAAFDLP